MFLFLAIAFALCVLICVAAIGLAMHCIQSWADFVGSGFRLDSRK